MVYKTHFFIKKISRNLFIINSTIYPQARNNVILKLLKSNFEKVLTTLKKIKNLKPEVGFFIFSSKSFKNILMRIGLMFKTKNLAESDQRWVNRKTATSSIKVITKSTFFKFVKSSCSSFFENLVKLEKKKQEKALGRQKSNIPSHCEVELSSVVRDIPVLEAEL